MRRLVLLLLALSACAHAPARAVPALDARVRARELYEAGVALASQGDLTRAEQYLASAHREGARDRESLIALLSVCVRASRLRSALAYAQPYLSDHPGEVELLQLVAALHYALGELTRARTALEQALAAEEARPEAHYLLGRVHFALRARQVVPVHGGEHVRRARGHYARYLALAPAGAHAEEVRLELSARDGGRTASRRVY